VPIPGTRRMERLDENIGATTVELTADELRAIDAAATIAVQGARGSGHERYMWPVSERRLKENNDGQRVQVVPQYTNVEGA
jgi:hypothetical protein